MKGKESTAIAKKSLECIQCAHPTSAYPKQMWHHLKWKLTDFQLYQNGETTYQTQQLYSLCCVYAVYEALGGMKPKGGLPEIIICNGLFN